MGLNSHANRLTNSTSSVKPNINRLTSAGVFTQPASRHSILVFVRRISLRRHLETVYEETFRVLRRKRKFYIIDKTKTTITNGAVEDRLQPQDDSTPKNEQEPTYCEYSRDEEVLEEEEILGSDDDEQEDPRDYCIGWYSVYLNQYNLGGYHPVKIGQVRESAPDDPFRKKTVQLLDDFRVSGVNGNRILLSYCSFTRTHRTLQGLHYLHTKCHIIHTDIKPENILVCISDSQIRRMAAEALDAQRRGVQLSGSAGEIC
ncbi:unnamed protein product [Schistosoma mattheei]|uniref:non-specific serine/threonine protein kinase n=1 Tax=Schistosoma mattheei TaxID=31246 RepID=A0A183PXW9_9TREM|nr:unnamed protein product [Schistosoma mattheei]